MVDRYVQLPAHIGQSELAWKVSGNLVDHLPSLPGRAAGGHAGDTIAGEMLEHQLVEGAFDEHERQSLPDLICAIETLLTATHLDILGRGAGASGNTVQLRRMGGKEDNEAVPMAYLCQEPSQERTCLMRLTIPENGCDDKVCHQIDLGMLLRA